MAVKPVENLKGFTSSRPPLVVFTICILLFAIVLLSLESYIKRNDVPDYDIDYDWNTLMQGFSKLEFCLLSNETQPELVTMTTTSSSLNTTSTPAATTSLYDEIDGFSTQNTSLSISVSFRAHTSSRSKLHHGSTHLYSKFTTEKLGIKDGKEQVYVTLELNEPLKPLVCQDAGCTSEILTACLNIRGPPYVFPKTRHPGICNASETAKPEKVTKMQVKPSKVDPVQWCSDGTVAKPDHQFDPKLTVMLSSAQRSLINMHLMYTSYFLFVMLITCVCYALVKGPPYKSRTITHPSIAHPSDKKQSAPI
ncbi:transmembrane protein 248-like [Lytechinus pictus]|uniref:transmembrane protein 248-like n=1 Tax=Lytechinus pictus TaxID=7653 RepID=UPI00240D6AF0|nr:transmembrane protein 248-like [Lytechinus pictus]XP_054749136.1 transmembrane protein 248-like [Lytechinus pictus]XP_054749137.1 transmembrane protein 248-like [Lytechinus pictus]